MSNDKRLQYENEIVLDQQLLNHAQDNLVNKLELIVDIEKPDGSYIYASDRNKYVGNIFYEALLQFPTIQRTVGEYLSPTLEFSTVELELNNVDGRLNNFLPSGNDFNGWFGNKVIVKLGLKDIDSTYKTIFEGFITDQGGFQRTVKSIRIIARDKFSKIDVRFPNTSLNKVNFPNLDDSKENLLVPIIYGDWTVNVEPQIASIPCIAVNGADDNMNGKIANTNNIQYVICNHKLLSFDSTQVYLRRSDKAWRIPSGDIVNISTSTANQVSSFEIKQESLNMIPVTPDTEIIKLKYSNSDQILVKVKGKILIAYNDNIIEQAKDILFTYGGLTQSDLSAKWNNIRGKNTPAESNIKDLKSRIYISEEQNVLSYVLSLLEQARIEAFVDRDLKLSLLPNHFDEYGTSFDTVNSFNVKNWDIQRGSFNLVVDERTNINKMKATYNLLPNRKENFNVTPLYKNQVAITQSEKVIAKNIIYPNLYIKNQVEAQIQEVLKITSAYLENINCVLTWRSMLLDVGDFVRLNINIQGTILENVPAIIRTISYSAEGMKIPLKLWSFQMMPFPNYNNNYSGTTGGSTAIITKD